MIVTSNPLQNPDWPINHQTKWKPLLIDFTPSLYIITLLRRKPYNMLSQVLYPSTNPILSIVLLFNHSADQSEQTDWCRWSWHFINISTSVITFRASSFKQLATITTHQVGLEHQLVEQCSMLNEHPIEFVFKLFVGGWTEGKKMVVYRHSRRTNCPCTTSSLQKVGWRPFSEKPPALSWLLLYFFGRIMNKPKIVK